MKQHEAVIDTIEKLGGIATLGQLYKEVLKIDECIWNTKTPLASIRRIVQQDKNIYKIKPGLYALIKYRAIFEREGIVAESQNIKANIEFNHSYYQGLLLEIGNMKEMITYIPPQDKNKLFINVPLKNLATIEKIFDFTYPTLVDRAKTIDVIWFNERKLLSSVFEIEYSTNIQNSLLKFYDLQDFNTKFYIVSSEMRKEEFVKKINYSSFKSVKDRVYFIDYQYISNLHTKMSELCSIKQL